MDFKEKIVKYSGYGFTYGQMEALDKLSTWYNTPKDHVFTLSGRAGTGKTYILKYFIDKIVSNPICVSAPTHKALRNVEIHTNKKGKTLQSLHGLRPNVNLEDFNLNNVKFDQLGTPTMNNYKIIVIDECSMINQILFDLTVRRAQDLNVKILFVGDPLQLPPVNKHNENDASISPTFLVKNCYELQEIVRQDSNNPLTELLEVVVDDVLRGGSRFIEFLTNNPTQVNAIGEGYKVYNSRDEFINTANDCFKSDEFSKDPDYSRIAAWKNDTVLAYNLRVRNSTISFFKGGAPVTELIDVNDLLIGYKTITDEFNDTVLINSEDYIVQQVVTRESESGFRSYAVKIKPRYGGKAIDVNIVDYRHVSFRTFYEIIKTKYFQALYGDTRIRNKKWRDYFMYKDTHLSLVTFPIKDGEEIKAHVMKDIDYAFGLTVHKLQGSTIKNTFVDINDMLYYKTGRVVMNSKFAPKATDVRNKLIYTALSRTSKFCNIYLNLK